MTAGGKTILVIDPDAASRSFISSTLRQHHYTVLQVASGREGLVLALRDLPDLIIIEPLVPDLPGLQLAARLLQDPRSAHVPLVALTTDNRAATRQACLEAGFKEYIVKSGSAVSLLVEAVERLLAPPPPIPQESRNGLSLAFISAKGGIGTSSICANLAMNIVQGQPGARVGMLDLVLPIGSIASIVGYQGTKNLVTLAELDPPQLPAGLADHMAETGIWGFDLLAGSPDPGSSSHLRVENIGDIIEQMRVVYDFVLLDMGRSLSRFSLPILQRSDLVVLIVSTDLSSVTITKTLLDFLHLQGLSNERIFTILNRAVGLEGMTKSEAEGVLEIEIKTTFPYLAHFTLANNQHQPFVVKYPGDNVSVLAFRDVAARIVETSRKLRAAAAP